jgi:hypothetical protein
VVDGLLQIRDRKFERTTFFRVQKVKIVAVILDSVGILVLNKLVD